MARAMIFVDAGAFIARHRETDDHHHDALRGWRDIEGRGGSVFTSNLVLVEAARFLCRFCGNARAAERIRLWLLSDRLVVLRPDREIEVEAADLLEKHADQQIGFTDCVSFVLMRRRRIENVFGFDRHFRIAGFKLWPAGRSS